MKKRIILTLGFLLLLSIPLFALTTEANAASCNGVQTSVDYNCEASNTDGVSAILMYVINFMAIGVGIAVVIGIIFGGITYAMSDGEESKAKEGREIIANSIIGLFLFIFLYAGANFLIPGGAFNLNPKPPDYASNSPTSGGSTSGGGTTGGNGSLTAATYNIRTTSLNRWDSARANSILSYIKTVDIVGIQEGKTSSVASKDSVGWLKSKLTSAGYSNYGAEQGGEYRVVFWQDSKFDRVDSGSYNIDANRNLVWVKLKLKATGTEFYFMTTHLDYNRCKSQYGANTTMNCVIRETQAKSIANYTASHMKSVPIILVGDMNSQVGSTAYRAFINGGFDSAYDIASSKVGIRSSIINNYSGGTSGTLSTGGKPIDHIYVKNGATVPRVEVTKNKGSDHVPVEAGITLPSK